MRRRLVAVLAAIAVGVGAAGSVASPAGARPASAYQSVLRAAATDLDRYWAVEFPALYAAPYRPLGRIVAARPGTTIPDCEGHRISYRHDLRGNAFYCRRTNY